MTHSRSGILNSFLFAIISSEFVKFIKPLDAYSGGQLSYSLDLTKSITIQKSKTLDMDPIHINDAIVDILKQRQFPLYVDVILQLEHCKIFQELEKRHVKLDLKVHAEPLFHETLRAIESILKTEKYVTFNEALASSYFFSSDYLINKKILLEYVLPYVIIFSAQDYLREHGLMLANFCSDLKEEIDQSFKNFALCKRPTELPDRIDRLAFHLKILNDDEECLPPEEAIKKARRQNAFIEQLLKMKQDHPSTSKSVPSPSIPSQLHNLENKPGKIKTNFSQQKANVPVSKGLYQKVLLKNHLSQSQVINKINENTPDAAPLDAKKDMRNSAPIKLLNQPIVSDHFQVPKQNTPRNSHAKNQLRSNLYDIAKMPMMPKPIKINERNFHPRQLPEPYVNTTKIKNIALNTLSHIGVGIFNQISQVKQFVTSESADDSEKHKDQIEQPI